MSVLTQLLNTFRASEPAPLPDPDARLATGALMVQIAMSDRNYQFEEISLIDRVLSQLFGLDAVDAAKMRATCEKLHSVAPDTETFAALIRSELDVEHRCEALTALWQVVMADGDVRDDETAIVETARLALGLSVADNAAARSRAEAALA
ncbi:TerB family tellurite resistance protein [Marinibacterium sp. SX1]|uniref:tellurite resistance TerB family protein n=1 Tax=Marinibacterium sp. SX1 TaxID=3388424 RepID=UPI003D1871D6